MVLELLLNPPPAVGLGIVMVGLILIWWSLWRRQSHIGPSATKAGKLSPDAVILIECHLGELPHNVPRTGEIVTLALARGAGSGSTASPIGFDIRFGPPGTACWEWHPEFKAQKVYRCDAINCGDRSTFNISVTMRRINHQEAYSLGDGIHSNNAEHQIGAS